MIAKEKVIELVNQWLEGKEYFLVDLQIDTDNKITVEIDQKEGVWIDDCVALSQYIESRLDREVEDYDLEVGSAGIGQPMKVLQQVLNSLGHEVEVLTIEGKKLQGILQDASEQELTIVTQQKVKLEGAKRPKLTDVALNLKREQIKYVKQLIKI